MEFMQDYIAEFLKLINKLRKPVRDSYIKESDLYGLKVKDVRDLREQVGKLEENLEQWEGLIDHLKKDLVKKARDLFERDKVSLDRFKEARLLLTTSRLDNCVVVGNDGVILFYGEDVPGVFRRKDLMGKPFSLFFGCKQEEFIEAIKKANEKRTSICLPSNKCYVRIRPLSESKGLGISYLVKRTKFYELPFLTFGLLGTETAYDLKQAAFNARNLAELYVAERAIERQEREKKIPPLKLSS